MSDVITTGDKDRCFRKCKCAKCGVVEVCTPTNDFYTIPKNRDSLIYCEACMYKIAQESEASDECTKI